MSTDAKIAMDAVDAPEPFYRRLRERAEGPESDPGPVGSTMYIHSGHVP
jgi:hypothetical protein